VSENEGEDEIKAKASLPANKIVEFTKIHDRS